MDDLAAAVAVVTLATDANADEQIEQRSSHVTYAADNAATINEEAMSEDKENIQGDAAAGNSEDGASQVECDLRLLLC